MLRRVPRTATVTAGTDALLWPAPGALSLDVVGGGPSLSPTLATGISARLAHTTARAR